MLDLSLYVNDSFPTVKDIENLINGASGPIRTKPRAYLLDGDLNPQPIPFPIETTRTNNISKWIVTCQVASNKTQDIPQEVDLKLREIPGIEVFDTLHDHVKIECAYYNSRRDIVLQLPVGVFGFDFPVREIRDDGNFWTIKGYDVTRRVARLTFLDTYTIPAGYRITDVVKAMLMADYLPPLLPNGLIGGRQPAGVAWASPTATQGLPPPIGTPSSTPPTGGFTFGPYGYYSPNGQRVDDIGTPYTLASGQPVLQSQTGEFYPTQSGARVDSNGMVIDPWTGQPMQRIGFGVFQASNGLAYITQFGWFEQLLVGGNTTGTPYDPFTSQPFVGQYRMWGAGAYTGLPLPLYSWPYDANGAGPFFTAPAGQTNTTVSGSTGQTVTGVAFPVEDARSGATQTGTTTVSWNGTPTTVGVYQTQGTVALGTTDYPLYGGIGLWIDPRWGIPWDPVSNNGPMLTVQMQFGGATFFGWQCSNGAVFDGVNFHFPGDWSASAATIDPITLQPSTTFTLASVPNYGTPPGGIVTNSTPTSPTIQPSPYPWPDINNPGLTPAGCPHVGPNYPASRIKCVDSDVTLPYPMPFNRKTSQMAAINGLLKAINYWPIFPDQEGNIIIQPTPYNSTTTDITTYQLPPKAWVFDTTLPNSVKNGVIMNPADSAQIANIVVVVCENNKQKPIVAVAYNMNANSKISIPNLGYSVVKMIQDDKIGGITDEERYRIALDRAMLELNLAAIATETAEWESALVPVTGVHDFPQLNVTTPDHQTYEIDSRYYPFEETSWTMDFQQRSMKHIAGRLVLI